MQNLHRWRRLTWASPWETWSLWPCFERGQDKMTSGPEVYSSDPEVPFNPDVLYDSLIDSIKCMYKFNAIHSNTSTTHSGIYNISLHKMKHTYNLHYDNRGTK